MVILCKSTENDYGREDNNMLFQEIYQSSIETPKRLARSLNKIIRRKINKNAISDYLELVNGEYIYTCKNCEKAYDELETILKKYRMSPDGKTKAAAIIYAHFRIIESYSDFQDARDRFLVNHDLSDLIKSLMIIRKQIRSIYVCKY